MNTNPALVVNPSLSINSSLKGCAQDALERGFSIFPLQPRKKEPLPSSRGFKEATTDRVILKRWDRFPDMNVGIATGLSGLCVFDFDKPDSVPTWLNDTQTYKVRSARGLHIYFRGARKSGKLHVDGQVVGDLKSEGGYVLAAGSIHPSGAMYTVVDDSSVAKLPDRVEELFHRPVLLGGGVVREPVDIALDGPPIPYGAHRSELLRIAGKMRRDGCGENPIYHHLLDCQKRCKNAGEDFAEMCRNIAHDVCSRYPKAESPWYEPGREPKPVGLFEPGGPFDVLPPITVNVRVEASDKGGNRDNPEHTASVDDSEKIPAFDESVITGIYRDIVDVAVGGTTIPPQYAFLNAKVSFGARMAGKVTFEGLDCDSSYYAAVIGDTGTGKGESWRRTTEKLLLDGAGFLDSTVKIIHSADSGAGLKDAFFDEPKELPIVCYIDEVTPLGHKSGEKKNPEILDTIIELADSHRISRVKARRGKQKSTKTHDNARLSLYMCGQDGGTFMSAFAGRTKIGLFDRLYPEFAEPVDAGDLPPLDVNLMRGVFQKVGGLKFGPHMTMALETKTRLDEFWKGQPPEILKKVRFRKHLMLDMYMAAFGRGVTVAEPQDLDVAVKIFHRQIIIRVSVSGRPSGQADADDLSGAGRMFSRFRREVPGKQFFDAVDGMVGDA